MVGGRVEGGGGVPHICEVFSPSFLVFGGGG